MVKRSPTPEEGLSGRDYYRMAAPIYDACTALWSGRAIWNSQLCQLEHMQRGSTALYAGGGQGRAAIEAARAGVHVTLVDVSPAMLGLAKARARRAGVAIRFVQADLWDWSPEIPFDHVVANHFFNVFHARSMADMRQRLIGWIAPSGSLHIADFRPLGGNIATRSLQRAHHFVPLSGCAALTRNALHPIYDHGLELGNLDWSAVQITDHRVWYFGPAWYRTWRFQQHARVRSEGPMGA
jgi:SAM-dependent methyltransferase